jgi:hypothetical protein
MVRVLALIAAAATALPASAQPAADQRPDHVSAFEARRQGKLMSHKEIERRVLPTMPGAEYLGFEFEPGIGLYTLKFLRNGAVIAVDVDGRSGHILGRRGR